MHYNDTMEPDWPIVGETQQQQHLNHARQNATGPILNSNQQQQTHYASELNQQGAASAATQQLNDHINSGYGIVGYSGVNLENELKPVTRSEKKSHATGVSVKSTAPKPMPNINRQRSSVIILNFGCHGIVYLCILNQGLTI